MTGWSDCDRFGMVLLCLMNANTKDHINLPKEVLMFRYVRLEQQMQNFPLDPRLSTRFCGHLQVLLLASSSSHWAGKTYTTKAKIVNFAGSAPQSAVLQGSEETTGTKQWQISY